MLKELHRKVIYSNKKKFNKIEPPIYYTILHTHVWLTPSNHLAHTISFISKFKSLNDNHKKKSKVHTNNVV